jgi:hypothetical protein
LVKFVLVLVLGLLATSALADLYRWVDPETGSVKFSSYPPPWYGDEARVQRAPRVEHIPARTEAPARRDDPAMERGPAGAKDGGGVAQELAKAMEALDERRRALVAALAPLRSREDFNRAGAGIRQQVEAYQALSAELDRMDPKGAERRRAAAQPILQRIAEGLSAQLSPEPPVRGAAK